MFSLRNMKYITIFWWKETHLIFDYSLLSTAGRDCHLEMLKSIQHNAVISVFDLPPQVDLHVHNVHLTPNNSNPDNSKYLLKLKEIFRDT